MNILHKFTLKSLRKNKVRTAVTVIGIMLSAAMICAVTTFVSSIYNYGLQNEIYQNGSWHGSAQDTTFNTFTDIEKSGKTQGQVYACQLGYAKADGCKNENKPYIYVLGAADGFEEMMSVHITEGRYPESTSEIILPKHLQSNGGITYNLGSSLTLDLGYRKSDGFVLGQNTPYYVYDSAGNEAPSEESFSVRESRTYTVVGFYERPAFEPYTAPGYTAITVADTVPDSSLLYSIWFKMNNAKDVYSFMEQIGISGDVNTDVLAFSGTFRYSSISNMVTGLAIIIISLIMFGSISLIYNAFSISVSERTKQFGLLSSLGATRKQLRMMVFYEAFAVSLIGIPLGVTVGIVGIGVTLLFVGNKFESLVGYTIPLRLNVSPLSIVIAVLVALVTVLISAYIPSKRPTTISAVEAIRLNRDITAKRLHRTSALTLKIFGLSGILAGKHYKRSRKKYRATVISLFMSIVLFVSASAFTDYLTESVTAVRSGMDYDIVYHTNNDSLTNADRDILIEHFKNDAAVTDVACIQDIPLFSYIDTQYLTDDFEIEDISELVTVSFGQKLGSVMTTLYFVDDTSYDAFLKENNLKPADFKIADSPKGVVVDTSSYFDRDNGKFININLLKKNQGEVDIQFLNEMDGYNFFGNIAGDDGETYFRYVSASNKEQYIDLKEEEAYTHVTLTYGAVIKKRPFFVSATYGLMFIYPDSLKETVLKDTPFGERPYSYYFKSSNHKESYKAIEKTLEESDIQGGYLYDYAETVEGDQNLVIIIKVFSFGFIVLISLIAAANVFNTISTNVSLRRREFAMLKSVGMSNSDFNRMMIYECLLYGSRSLLYGLPFSVFVTYLIYLVVNEGYTAYFRLPINSIAIAVLSVFAVVFASMIYAMHKIKKDNPLEALKNENL